MFFLLNLQNKTFVNRAKSKSFRIEKLFDFDQSDKIIIRGKVLIKTLSTINQS